MAVKRNVVKSKHYLTLQQLEYFRERLLHLRQELEGALKKHSSRIQDESLNEPDAMDRASIETTHSLEIEAQSRERGQILKINQALERINNGTYGFCEETGAPIGLARLDAYPTATLCVEIQNL